MAEKTPTRAQHVNPPAAAGIPGSAVDDHPLDGIPLPAHGFSRLDATVREIASIPAAEVISRAAVLLMSASAEKLGLVPGEEPDLDLDEARRLITALAGLLAASRAELGPHGDPLRNGLKTLQEAFREASVHPDEPGAGPGEALLS
ncbi:MAG TPA: DUF1844 domain-containing protein [Jatrophihabitans sp.]|nr:DUF1844 domain-containing protein [Jatrophihabitans sp.]